MLYAFNSGPEEALAVSRCPELRISAKLTVPVVLAKPDLVLFERGIIFLAGTRTELHYVGLSDAVLTKPSTLLTRTFVVACVISAT